MSDTVVPIGFPRLAAEDVEEAGAEADELGVITVAEPDEVGLDAGDVDVLPTLDDNPVLVAIELVLEDDTTLEAEDAEDPETEDVDVGNGSASVVLNDGTGPEDADEVGGGVGMSSVVVNEGSNASVCADTAAYVHQLTVMCL